MHPTQTALAALRFATLLVLAPAQAIANSVFIQLESTVGIAGKPAATLGPLAITSAQGKAKTFFLFHPSDHQITPFQKNLQTQRVSPNPITHHYLSQEEHQTTGSVTYDVRVNKVTIGTADTYNTTASVSATINPGENEQRPSVNITADIEDPFTFGNQRDANFPFVSEGIDLSLSLGAATAFPDIFSPDGLLPGAIAGNTHMSLSGRVASGVVSDPDAFWDPSLAGAVDLYTLDLMSDASHVVTATLTFASNTADFTLDFLNHLGSPFDPTNSSEVGLIEDFIAGAFVNGRLVSDLTTLFTVGFVPQASGVAYTLGRRDHVYLTAIEVVPEPATAALLLVALAAVAAVRRPVPVRTTGVRAGFPG